MAKRQNTYRKKEDCLDEIAVFFECLRGRNGVSFITASAAARRAGLARRTVYAWREDDDEFRRAWEDAEAEGTEVLEAEANRRAFVGTLKPVYQQGRRVGTVREFSDALAALLLKKRNPEFKERHEHSGTGEGGAIIIQSDPRLTKV